MILSGGRPQHCKIRETVLYFLGCIGRRALHDLA